jgi:hypothetical protein
MRSKQGEDATLLIAPSNHFGGLMIHVVESEHHKSLRLAHDKRSGGQTLLHHFYTTELKTTHLPAV